MSDPIQEILRNITKIAIVGYSSDSEKTSHMIPQRLEEEGYDIYAVNPKGGRAFHKDIYEQIEDVPPEVDSILFFRPGEDIIQFLPALLKRKNLKHVWLQLGIKNGEVKTAMETKGVKFIQDKCMAVELSSRGGLQAIRNKAT